MSLIENKVNKFDKPHLPVPLYDLERKTDMFNAVLSLDTHEILQCNLMYKIPFTISDDNKNSLIHILINNPSKSSELAKLSVIKFLINNGVDPDKPNKYNQTALHLACKQQLEKIVDYLLKNNTNSNYKDNSGFTPFHYLLRGSINPVPLTEIIDFIPPTNNVNFAKVEFIKDMKQEITNILDTLDKLPIFETIQNTIIAFIGHDAKVKKIIQEFRNAQLAKLKQDDGIFLAEDISQSIKQFQTDIKKRISEQFPIKSLTELMIHEKKSTSWGYPDKAEYAIITDGNIDVSIRTTIKNQYDALENLMRNFDAQLYKIDFNTNNTNIYMIMYNELYITLIKNNIQLYINSAGSTPINTHTHFRMILSVGQTDKENKYKTRIKSIFEKQDDILRYKTASDNASSIINFKTLKYTGGPRYIRLGNNLSYNNKDEIYNEIDNILHILNSIITDSKLIEYMLGVDYINTVKSRSLDLFNLDDSNHQLLDPHIDKIVNNMNDYLYLSLEAIKYKLNMNTRIMDTGSFPNLTLFGKKWLKKWKPDKDFDLGAWIFNMWTDCSCRTSRSNLIGFVDFKLLLLINNLNNLNNITDIRLHIFNSLKPHLISRLFDKITGIHGVNEDLDIIINIIIILLFDSNDINDLNIIIKIIIDSKFNIYTDRNHIINGINTYLSNKENIIYIINLIELYFTDELINRSDTKNAYDTIKTKGVIDLKKYHTYDTFIDILCNMIFEEYQKMSNKPLKQTILDFLYLLNEYNKYFDTSIFKSISIIPIIDYSNHTVNIPLLANYIMIPSYYGYLNVANSLINYINITLTREVTTYNQMVYNHFIIAHILGLYYEGTLNMINYEDIIKKLVKTDKFNSTQDFIPGKMYLPSETIALVEPHKSMSWRHTIYTSTNQLQYYQVPLVLQFTYIDTHDFDEVRQLNIITIKGECDQYISKINAHIDYFTNASTIINNGYLNERLMREIITTAETILNELILPNTSLTFTIINNNNTVSEYYNPNTINNIAQLIRADQANKNNIINIIQTMSNTIGRSGGLTAYCTAYLNNCNQFSSVLIQRMTDYCQKRIVIYNLLKKTYSYNYNDYADLYNIWGKPIVLPTTISYFIFLYDKIRYYQTIIKNKYTEIQTQIRAFITGNNAVAIKDAYGQTYFDIIILSKIINNYYKSCKEIDLSEFFSYPKITKWINSIQEIKNLKLIEPLIYDEDIAKILNKINSSYYIYHYIFQDNKQIKLNKFNYYQLPSKDEAIKYLYFNGLGNMFDSGEKIPTLPQIPASDMSTDIRKYNTGLFNIYDITNYTTTYEKYTSNPYYLNNKDDSIITEPFVRDKTADLPPSVYINFDDFYKYTTIYLIQEIISKEITSTLVDMSRDYIKKYIKPPNKIVEVYVYYLISKIIEQLIINRYTINITDQIIKKKLQIMNLEGGAVDELNMFTNFDYLLSNLEKQYISITLDNSKQPVSSVLDLSNLYNLVISPSVAPDDEKPFILYPNDLTNINKFKIKNGITIKSKIIKLLIDGGGNPYHLNMENSTPIDYLLKNYQIETITELYSILQERGINYNSENSIKYIMGELNNMLGKIIFNVETIELKSILSNFHMYLYEDIHQLIMANNHYGNNEFISIPISFNISTYLTLHYLKSTLDTDDTNLYLYTQMNELKIPKKTNILIAQDVLSKKQELLTNLQNYLSKLQKITSPSNLEEAQKTQLINDILLIQNDIKSITSILSYIDIFNNQEIKYNTHDNLINAYEDYTYGNTKSLKSLKVWDTFFNISDKTINITNNTDMDLINLIIQQIQEINNLDKLKIISDKLKKISTVGEEYFLKPKFTKDNNTTLFIKEMLIYVATITFEPSIYLLVKHILFKHFSQMYKETDKINNTIRYILEIKTDKSNETFINTLKNTIKNLVILASNIYEDKKEEMNYEMNSSRQILLNLFAHLKSENSITPSSTILNITLSEEILNIFDRKVVEYLDTFIVKTIEMWHVNAENIFKYFINNYRCLATLICLIDHK